MLMNVSTKRKNIHKQGNNFYPVIKKKSTVQKNKHTCKVITVMQSLKKKKTVQKKHTHLYNVTICLQSLKYTRVERT